MRVGFAKKNSDTVEKAKAEKGYSKFLPLHAKNVESKNVMTFEAWTSEMIPSLTMCPS
jgi:hypothetical protein